MKPKSFNVDEYAKWHDVCCPKDTPILKLLPDLRELVTTEARPCLDFLDQIFKYMFTYSRNEYLSSRDQKVTYQTPLSESLRAEAESGRYDSLFKSVPSIVNKMWRKSTDSGPAVTADNFFDSITDLIRTDVHTETLASAQFLAARMNRLPDVLYDFELKAKYNDLVTSCVFEPEMKMASGYFAYHGLIRFKRAFIVVEVQIYSALMSEWRKLSHRLYERVRLEPIPQHEFGSKESRLISLGHLLHLAECEIQRLAQEIEERKPL